MYFAQPGLLLVTSWISALVLEMIWRRLLSSLVLSLLTSARFLELVSAVVCTNDERAGFAPMITPLLLLKNAWLSRDQQ